MRKYDFSKLKGPLSECGWAYSSPTKDGRFEIWLNRVDLSRRFEPVIVLTVGSPYEAREACNELHNMVAAAKALVKGST